MLMLMTLLLLASSTCRAQYIQGNHKGTYFYIRGGDQREIQVIRIFLTPIKRIMGIQLKFGNSWSDVSGSKTEKPEEFHLENGEYVVKVNGSVRVCVSSLSFTTNKERVASFGVPIRSTFDDSGGSDKRLVTVNGLHLPGLCITGLGFQWGPFPEKLVSTDPLREPMRCSDVSKEKEDEKDEAEDKEEDDDRDEDDDDEDNDRDEDDSGEDSNDDDEEEEEEEEEEDEKDEAEDKEEYEDRDDDDDDDNDDAQEENE